MIVDALILAGGRSSRLGGHAKSQLSFQGVSLLDGTLQAVADVAARRVVIVGDELRDGVLTVREEPAFAGPVAAIATGLRPLSGDADAVLVLACDMPRIAAALPPLLAGFARDGVIAVDGGHLQQLALLIAPSALARAVAATPVVVDTSMRELLAPLDLVPVEVPAGSTDDIDTWEDADRLDVATPHSRTGDPR